MSTIAPSEVRRRIRRRGAFAAGAVAAVLGAGLPQPASADHAPIRSLTAACLAGHVSPNRFVDVPAVSAFELAINCIGDYAITQGTSPGRYSPSGVVTRQQMALFLVRAGAMMGIAWNPADAGFRDIAGLSPEARGSVNALANARVAQGTAPGRFDPAGTVTRGQMASFLARLADAAALKAFASKGDAFDDDEESVHRASIDRIAAAGVTGGRRTDRTFDPLSPVTREQMAAFLARTLAAAVAEGKATPRHDPNARPTELALDQAGDLIEPGQALTGQVTGDRIASVSIVSPCTGTVPAEDRDPGAPGVQFSAATDPQAPMGHCVVAARVTYGNGRTEALSSAVLVPGYMNLPELIHVERVGSSTAAGYETSEIRYVYDEPIVLTPEGGRFGLNYYYVDNYDADSAASTGARQDTDRSVIATFGTARRPVGPADLEEVSYATHGNVVRDRQGNPPPEGTKAVLNPGSNSARAFAGPTWQPDLLSVTDRRPDPADPNRFLVEFTFDSRLRPLVGGDQYVFDVVLADGTGRRCRPVNGTALRRITASCDATNTAGSSGTIARGSAGTEYREPGVLVARPLTASLLTRRPTALPDLVSAAWGPGPDQLTVAFDEPVNINAPDRFQLFTVEGGTTPGQARVAAVPGDPKGAVVTLIHGRLPNHSLLSLRGGAVTSRSTGKANSFEQMPLPHNAQPRPAGTPDGLLRVAVDDKGHARYTHRYPLYVDEATGQLHVDAGLYLPDGTRLSCDDENYDVGPNGQKYDVILCRHFLRPGSTELVPLYATPEQVKAAVWGISGADGILVDGARRQPPAPARPAIP